MYQFFGCGRWVFNRFFRLSQYYYKRYGKGLSYGQMSKHLTHLKKRHTFLNDVSSVALQQELRHLMRAFIACGRGTAKYPRYKRKSHSGSFSLMTNSFRVKGAKVEIGKIKTPVRFKRSRALPLDVTSATVSQTADGKWYVSFTGKIKVEPKAPVLQHCGIDLGIKDFVTPATETPQGKQLLPKVKLPASIKAARSKLRAAQKDLSRKKKGSRNFVKARVRVARIHQKVCNIRNDFHHKLSTILVSENQVISIETLRIQNMMKNHKLARAIADQGWFSFIEKLRYKCDWYGRQLVELSPTFPSSKLCSACGVKNTKLQLGDRVWSCGGCGCEHDRDYNAAVNILEAGTASLWRDVRQTLAGQVTAIPLKQEFPQLAAG
jgi:putative transposase